MIEKAIPKDVRSFETKLIGPFTTRQTICVILMAACVFLMYKLFGVDSEIKQFLCFVIVAPFAIAGWFKPGGMPAEKFVIECILPVLLSPVKRKYKVETPYDKLIEKTPIKPKKSQIKGIE